MANIYCAFPWGLALSQEFYLYQLISSSRQPPEAGTAYPFCRLASGRTAVLLNELSGGLPAGREGDPEPRLIPVAPEWTVGMPWGMPWPGSVDWPWQLECLDVAPVAVLMVTSCVTLRPPRKLSGPQFAHPRNGDSSTVLLMCWRRKWHNKGWEQFLS